MAKEWSQRSIAMERQARVSEDQFIERMRVDFEQTMRQVAIAVNQAPNGHWIDGSEVRVSELMMEFRRRSYETALQMRVDEAEGAFSPGGQPNAQEKTEQRV